jgi:hypothetical protein
MMRPAIAILLSCCFFQGVCQTTDESLYTLYNKLFFQRPGQPIAALTDQEIKTVETIAADCRDATNAASRQHPTAWDLLMESIETGQDNSEKAQQVQKDRNEDSHRIVLLHIGQLRTALGAARFDALTAWLDAQQLTLPKAGKRQ